MNGIFPRYADASLKDFQVRWPDHEAALKTVKSYIEGLRENRARGHGLTFLGLTGVGKTFLASMVLKEATAQGYSVESIEVDNYATLLHNKMMWSDMDEDDLAYKSHQHITRIRSKVDFLLLDDVGREHDPKTGPQRGAGWSGSQLFNLIRHRSNRLRPCLLTTNLTMEELDLRYGEGFSSLLHEATDIIVIEAEDHRCREEN